MLSLSSYAQTHVIDSVIIDSLTFAKARKDMESLPNAIFEKHIFKTATGELPYRLLQPKNYDKKRKYPVVIALHNSSRIGNDNEKQLEHLSKIWVKAEIYDQYNAFVIVPQFSSRSSVYAKDKNGSLLSSPSNDVGMVLDILKALEKKYNIDKSRIYLIGYSMGASTAQNLINMSPKTFAALVSVAAVPDISHLEAWKNKSILLIHGQKDVDNPYDGSALLYGQLHGNTKLVFKTYTNLNHHNITIPLLLNADIPEWLFKQRL